MPRIDELPLPAQNEVRAQRGELADALNRDRRSDQCERGDCDRARLGQLALLDLEAHPAEVAAIIVEPVAGNMGVVPPAPGFLAGLRELATRHGALLIFDEVITGFRVAWGGAQARYDVRPDLTCLGKIIGGGYPLAAFGGRADVMDRFDARRAGALTHGGTFNGNPVSAAAGAPR